MFDLIIKNGTVIDGSGSDGFVADVAVQNGKIAAIGKDLGDAKEVISAEGLAVTPGFVDSHSHSNSNIFTFPEQKEKIEQGITVSISGQCGSSVYPARENGKIVPMSEFLHRAYDMPQGSSSKVFLGHSTLRKAVMGMDCRPATESELEQMKLLLREAMDAGAMGISFGLIYTPSCYAKTEELIELAKVAKEKGGMIAAHIRNEGDTLVEAVEEFLTVIKAARIRGVVSHHKAAHKKNHGKVKITLEMLNKANAEGYDVYCDVYPYLASRTRLAATFIPSEYVNEHLSEYLKDPAMRAKFKEYAIGRYGEDLSWVLLNDCTVFPDYTGLILTEAAKLHGKDGWETLHDILETQPDCQACFFTMREEDMEMVMKWERAMICTDSGVACNLKRYHPRLRGTFPRVLGRYVREKKIVSLPEMIRKITSLPASVYQLEGKGKIQVGFDADLCIFDPNTIIDRADYDDITRRAEGLNYVILNGRVVVENAVFNGKCLGKVMPRRSNIPG